MAQVTLKILFFAASKDLAGVNSSTLELPQKISFEDLKAKVCGKFNLEIIADNVVLAVNQNYFDSGEIELKVDKGEKKFFLGQEKFLNFS